jgi:hypothetical protein
VIDERTDRNGHLVNGNCSDGLRLRRVRLCSRTLTSFWESNRTMPAYSPAAVK